MANDQTERPKDQDELSRSSDEDMTGRANEDNEEFEDVEEDESDEEDVEE